jgi:hypothetical protein
MARRILVMPPFYPGPVNVQTLLRLIVLAACTLLLGCSSQPERPAERDGRNTPLNEEVDEVEKVREEVLD